MHSRAISVATAVACLGLSSVAQAEDLSVGIAAEPVAIDPHFFRTGPNMSLRENISDALVYNNQDKGEIEPRLASRWEAEGTRWRFELNPKAVFADGRAVSPADVVFSLCRVRNVPNSPGSFISFIESIASIEPDGESAFVVETKGPDPVLLENLSTIGIVQAPQDASLAYDEGDCGNAEWIATEDFNNGRAEAGIGPYRVSAYRRGIETVLERNDSYYGPAPHYERITLRSIPENGARIAALLSGGVDVIDAVPVNAIDQIDANPQLQLISAPASRLIFFAFDQGGEPSPKITGTEGRNPLKDPRVRKALNLAVDRAQIVSTIMDGIAEPAGGIVMGTVFGANPELQPLAFDPEEARRLLSEAGYPQGFKMTISAPTDRYRNDTEVAQAVTQMLAAVGLDVSLETYPQSVYFDRANNYEYSMYLGGASADSGEGLSQLLNLVHTRDMEAGLGGANRGRYSSPEVDRLLGQALVTLDAEARRKMLQDAQALVYAEDGYMPLFHEVAVWAARADVHFEPSAAQFNILYTARPAN
jgi:peptide/nickel transport system substrate-binding protein